MNRLFIALWPTPTVRQQLTELCTPLTGLGRVIPAERLHMTLEFIGEFAEAPEPLLIEQLASVRAPAFTLRLDHWGQFNRSRTLWVGPSSPPPALLALRTDVARVLESFGHYPEPDFVPHVTLARRVKQAPAHQPPLELHWLVDTFALVRSHLTDQGPEYRILARFALIKER